MSDDLQLPLEQWTQSDTREWLTAFPLPVEFRWVDRDDVERAVLPSHRTLKGGYGKWLHETPYFPGLFELCHGILQRTPRDQPLTPEWLAEELQKYRAPTQEKFL